MKFLKQYWPTIMAVAGGGINFLMPSITVFITQHPKSAISVLLGCVVAAYHSTAPKDQNIVNR